jgi:sulfide dehydrogenase cytochrome subunit
MFVILRQAKNGMNRTRMNLEIAMKAYKYLFLAPIVAIFSVASAADIGAMMDNCNGCHGDNGVSQWGDVPTIAGIDAFGIADALFMYRDEERPCSESEYRQGDTSRAATTMCALTADLSDDDIELLGDAYAELAFVPAVQEFDAALAAAGAAVHEQQCDKCHSDGGANVEDEASILAGQWITYLENSFADFLSGDRPQDKKMREKLDALSADDVTALVHYYASQQ